MSYYPSYEPGDWKGACQLCGRVYKGSKLKRRWDGVIVCRDDYEDKHPQYDIKGVSERALPPFTFQSPVVELATIFCTSDDGTSTDFIRTTDNALFEEPQIMFARTS